MNNIKKITAFSLVAGMFLIAALATSTVKTAFAQNPSTAINETAAQLNETASKLMQTAAQLNETAAQSVNKTSTTNQTSANKPDLTTSDIQDIQKTLEDVKKSIAEGKAVEALKQINQIDDKLLDAMSNSPPPMLDKSSGNDNSNKNN
jgi:mannose/fructose/N-acetylgalactosamine-specific phosphotransferase system component IID